VADRRVCHVSAGSRADLPALADAAGLGASVLAGKPAVVFFGNNPSGRADRRLRPHPAAAHGLAAGP